MAHDRIALGNRLPLQRDAHERRHRSGGWGWLVGAALFVLGIALSQPASGGEADDWDHRAMRTRHQSHHGDPARPRFEGTTRFGQLERGEAVETRHAVPDRPEHVSQRTWEGRSGGPMLDTPLIAPAPSQPAGRVGNGRSADRGRTGNGPSALRGTSVRR